MAPLVALLLQHGLGLLADTVQKKGQEFVEEKLNIKLPSSSQTSLTSEEITSLRKIQEENSFKLVELTYLDAQDARKMNLGIQDSDKAAPLAKVAAYYMDFMIIISVIFLAGGLFFQVIPEENKELSFTVFGYLLAMAGTVVGFHRGNAANKGERHGL